MCNFSLSEFVRENVNLQELRQPSRQKCVIRLRFAELRVIDDQTDSLTDRLRNWTFGSWTRHLPKEFRRRVNFRSVPYRRLIYETFVLAKIQDPHLDFRPRFP